MPGPLCARSNGLVQGPFFFVRVSLKSLELLVEQALAGLGYELVDLEFAGRGLLRVFIDRPGAPLGPTVDDCEMASRHLLRVFEVEAVDFSRLEVSSPGLDRALKKATDFDRFVGEEVALRLRLPVQGRRQFQGVLGSLEGGRWVIEWTDTPPVLSRGRNPSRSPVRRVEPDQTPSHRIEFALDDIERARLVPRFEFSGVRGR